MFSDVTFGSCIDIEGTLRKSSRPDIQPVEVLADKITVIGPCDTVKFPFKTKKSHPVDYVRDFLHLRPKTNTFASLLRIRSAAAKAIHDFFHQHEFCQIDTPILTSNDCEGAGEIFQVEPESKKLESHVDGTVEHYFRVPTYLTVSGQLHLEAVAGAVSKVYTFGPIFRAENTRGRHHLSEFYMIEAEMAFTNTLQDVLKVIEGVVRFVTEALLQHCEQDLDFFMQRIAPPHHRESIDKIVKNDFVRMDYSEAIHILEKYNDKFNYQVKWGCDLQREHERHLVEHCNNIPVFVTDYPTEVKPFYMKLSGDNTVAAVDLLAPGVGEIVGGSLREDNLKLLTNRLHQLGLKDSYQWYLDLRRFGSAPHGGFGLGFERYLQMLLGIQNIRDTIPFPRYINNCRL